MPVPRRFDRRPPDRDTTRINDRIRVPEVRLVGEDGKQIGVVKTSDALAYAQERDLDLVEVAPDARPPVCRVLDYSKYKYEQAQKQKAARKHQQQITIREIKFRPKIAQNDYDTKKGHVTRFLRGHDKVKITIMFRGREVTHPERGTALLDRLAGELADIAVIEQSPLQDGRNMTMLLAPSKAVLAEERGAKPAAEAKQTENGAGPNAGLDAAPAPEQSAPPAEQSAPPAEQTATPAEQSAPPAEPAASADGEAPSAAEDGQASARPQQAAAAAEKSPRSAKVAAGRKPPADGEAGDAGDAAASDATA
ncbi:MAG: translation initiation factor [Solirubrobacteraceae bacterium]|nr:translation initiation factor [Solirubrobacteraceae bacterium]